MRSGRSRASGALRVPLLVLALGVLAATGAASATWFRPREASAVLGASATVIKGRDVVPAGVPLALVAVAGAVAVLAARPRVLRVLAAAVVVLAGVGLAVLALRAVLDPGRAVGSALTGRGSRAAVPSTGATGLGWLAVLAGMLLAAAGVLVGRAPRRRLATSTRYDAPGAQAEAPTAGAPLSEWEAVERGVDPTAPPAADSTAGPAAGTGPEEEPFAQPATDPFGSGRRDQGDPPQR